MIVNFYSKWKITDLTDLIDYKLNVLKLIFFIKGFNSIVFMINIIINISIWEQSVKN